MTDNLALVLAPILGSLVLYVWTAASLHAVFRKAGEEGWQAWVPVLNIVVLLRLGSFSGWWVLLLLVPGLGALALAVVVWIACSRINTAFGVGMGMTVLAVLLFPVWSSILGWGSARWLGREQRMPGPVRSGGAPSLDGRMPMPAYGAPAPVAPPYPAAAPAAPPPAHTEPSSAVVTPYASGGIPLDNIPPRPATVPPAPPAGWPASPAPAMPAPAIVTRVPSAGQSLDEDDADDVDDPSPQGFAPRRRSDARAAEGAIRYADDPADPPEPIRDHSAHSAAPYTGTLPRLIDAGSDEVPAGPRRAVMPEPDDGAVDHLIETRDAPPSAASLISVPSPNGRDPWAPPDDLPPVHTPRYSPTPPDGGFSETSAEVSAVVGAPSLGAPMAARYSVSSLRDEPELPDAEGAFDDTIIATRRRTPWMLHPPLGAPIAVTSDVLIVGRRPSSDPAIGHAQLIPVADETRTMSKTHARLELRGDHWVITDLDSTNGVVLLSPDGGEVELASGDPQPVTETFLLGDAELRLSREHGVE